MARDVSNTPTIVLRVRPGPGVDPSPHIVCLTRETETDFWGWPLSNPRCPVLQWPKFAWVEITQ